MLSCISRREPAQQTCPWLNQMPSTRPSTALSRSASSKMMNGDLPPSSSESRLWLDAVALRMARPTSVEPVNAILSTSGCLTSASPVEPSPVTMLTTPGGSPISEQISAKASAVSGVNSAGLSTTVLPVASAGAIFQASISSGKFHGNDLADDAARRVSGKFLMQQLRPAGVVIEVAGDQRNIDVAALANRLAVVHGLEHGETAGMLLHGSRQRVEIASSRVRSERLPFRQSCAGGSDGGVDVRSRSLGDCRELLAGGGIGGFEVSTFRRLSPCAVDEMSEAAAVEIQPGEGFFRVLRRGTVFHGDELFSDAHIGLVSRRTRYFELEHKSQSRKAGSDKECPTHTFVLYASGWR